MCCYSSRVRPSISKSVHLGQVRNEVGGKTHAASSTLANCNVNHTPVPCSGGLLLAPGPQYLWSPALQVLSVTEHKQVSGGPSDEDGWSPEEFLCHSVGSNRLSSAPGGHFQISLLYFLICFLKVFVTPNVSNQQANTQSKIFLHSL